jgi:hypothetical protein
MSHWNYRLMRYRDEAFGDTFGIHEVHYDDDGKPKGFTERAVGVVVDSVAEVPEVLAMMAKAASKPVLEHDDFPNEMRTADGP